VRHRRFHVPLGVLLSSAGEALQSFQKAVDLDPNLALAYTGMAAMALLFQAVAEFRTPVAQSAEALRKEVGGLEVTQVLSAKVYKDAESLEKPGNMVKALSKL
jgi:hypothetical protein